MTQNISGVTTLQPSVRLVSSLIFTSCQYASTHTTHTHACKQQSHTHTHARTHARTHAHTHTHMASTCLQPNTQYTGTIPKRLQDCFSSRTPFFFKPSLSDLHHHGPLIKDHASLSLNTYTQFWFKSHETDAKGQQSRGL